MAENKNKYTLLLQNNASKEFLLYSGLTNISTNRLYVQFEEDLTDLPAGEYTYATFINNRDDVVYEYKTPLLHTILHTGDGDVVLGALHPSIGLLKIGEPGKGVNIYQSTTPEENNDNNTIFYYDGD